MNSDQTFDPEQRCPLLGLQDDPETWFGFPADDNFCHKANPITRIAPAFQQDTCLAGQYNTCLLYRQEGRWRNALPTEMRPGGGPARLRPFAGRPRTRTDRQKKKAPQEKARPPAATIQHSAAPQPQAPNVQEMQQEVNEASGQDDFVQNETASPAKPPAPRSRRKPLSRLTIAILIVTFFDILVIIFLVLTLVGSQ